MWKKPKKKKVLAPVTQKLKDLREMEVDEALEKTEKFFQTMEKIKKEEELNRSVSKKRVKSR